jgi:CRP-like cAMP-binding protein
MPTTRRSPRTPASLSATTQPGDASERLRILRSAGPFRDLPATRLAPLVEHSRVVAFPPGCRLLRQGEAGEALYIVSSGQVRVEYAHPHLTQALSLAELGPGAVVGEIGLLTGRPCSATVTATLPTMALELPMAGLFQAMRALPEVTDILVRILGRRLQRNDAALESELEGPVLESDALPISTEEGVCYIDLLGRVTSVNLAAARLTGYKIPELLGRDLHAVMHPAHVGGEACATDACSLFAALQHLDESDTADASPLGRGDAIFWRRDGSSFPVEYASAAQHEDGEFIGIAVTFRPLGARERDTQSPPIAPGPWMTRPVPETLAVGLAIR